MLVSDQNRAFHLILIKSTIYLVKVLSNSGVHVFSNAPYENSIQGISTDFTFTNVFTFQSHCL